MVISLTATIQEQAWTVGDRKPDMQREAALVEAALEAIGWRVVASSPLSGGAAHSLRFHLDVDGGTHISKSVSAAGEEPDGEGVSVETSVRENINSVTWDEEGAASR